jgi:hypothetical protein
MTSVQITSKVSIGLDQLLNGVSQLETTDLEQFVGQVSAMGFTARRLTRTDVINVPTHRTTIVANKR